MQRMKHILTLAFLAAGCIQQAQAAPLRPIAADGDCICGSAGPSSTSVGEGASAPGDESTAVGVGAMAGGEAAAAFGEHSDASGEYASSFGCDSSAGGLWANAFGFDTHAPGVTSTSMGPGCISGGGSSICIGAGGSSPGDSTISIGEGNVIGGSGSIGVGQAIFTADPDSICWGRSSSARRGSIAGGLNAHATGLTSISFGQQSWCAADNSVCMGQSSSSTTAGLRGISSGYLARVTGPDAIAMGTRALAAAGEVRFGSTTNPTNTIEAVGTLKAVSAPAVGDAGLLITANVDGTTTMRQVHVGADSSGPGGVGRALWVD